MPEHLTPQTRLPQAAQRGAAVLALTVCLLSGCNTWRAIVDERPANQARELTEECRDAQQQGDLEQATVLLNQAARKNPADVEILREQVRLHQRRRDETGQMRALRQLLAQMPDDVSAWVDLATLQQRAEDYAGANHSLSEALYYDPRNLGALQLRAELEEQRQQPEVAMETCLRMLEIDPENEYARLKLAAIYLDRRQPQRAAPLLREVCHCPLATEESKIQAWRLLGTAYGQHDRWADAILALQEAVQLQQGAAAEDYYRLAYACCQAGEHEQARQYAAWVLQHDPDQAECRQLAASLGQSAEPGLLPVGHHSPPAASIPRPDGW